MVKPMIKFVLKEEISEIINNFANNASNEEGKFLTVEGNKYVAVDNSTGDAWTEEFDDIQDAIDWLNGKFEISEYFERVRVNA